MLTCVKYFITWVIATDKLLRMSAKELIKTRVLENR